MPTDAPPAMPQDQPAQAQDRSEQDVIDRLLAMLLQRFPSLADRPHALDDIAAEVRGQFGGQRAYIRRDRSAQRRRIARSVLASFNGANAHTVARQLGIGVATVYRVIKQPGMTGQTPDDGGSLSEPIGECQGSLSEPEKKDSHDLP